MASNYPAGLDSFDTIDADDRMSDQVGGRRHRDMHNDVGDAVEAVQTELGADPSGSAATVSARLDGIEAGTRLGVDSVTAAQIAENAVGATQIAANAVGASELADNAVNVAALDADDLGNGLVLTADSGEPSGMKWSAYGIADLDIGTVDTGTPAAASMTGNPQDGYALNLTLPPVGNGSISDVAVAADADIDRTKIAGTALTAESTGIFSVKDFGAVGDGTTDDTAAVQATINAAQAAAGTLGLMGGATGATVYFPQGDYKITAAFDPITKDNVFLVCDTPCAATLLLPDALTTFTWAGGVRGGGLVNLRLFYAAGGSTSTVTADIQSVDWRMTDCTVFHPARLLTIGTDHDHWASNIRVEGTKITVRSDMNVPVIDVAACAVLTISNVAAVTYPVSGNNYPHGTDLHNVTAGRDFLRIVEGDTFTITNGTMIYGFDNGVCLAPTVSSTLVQNVTISDSWIDMCRTALMVTPAAGAGVLVVRVTATYLCGTDVAGVVLQNEGVGGTLRDVTLDACTITYCGTDGLRLIGTIANVTMSGGSVTGINRLGTGGHYVAIDNVNDKDRIVFQGVHFGAPGDTSPTGAVSDNTLARKAKFLNCSFQTTGTAGVTNPPGVGLIGKASVKFDVLTDQPIPIWGENTSFVVTKVVVRGTNGDCSAGVGGICDGPEWAGTQIVAASFAFTAISYAGAMADVTVAAAFTFNTARTLYFNLQTAGAANSTADIYVYGYCL